MPRKRAPQRRTRSGVAALLDYAAQISAEQGVSPLEFLLSVMRDIANPLELRIDAAKAAAPYVHA